VARPSADAQTRPASIADEALSPRAVGEIPVRLVEDEISTRHAVAEISTRHAVDGISIAGSIEVDRYGLSRVGP